MREQRTRLVVISTRRIRALAKSIRFAASRTQSTCSLTLWALCGPSKALHVPNTRQRMRPGSVFGLTTLGLVSRTSMDDRLGEGPPLWEGEQQFHAFLGYALLTAMAAACADSVSHSSRRWRH